MESLLAAEKRMGKNQNQKLVKVLPLLANQKQLKALTNMAGKREI